MNLTPAEMNVLGTFIEILMALGISLILAIIGRISGEKQPVTVSKTPALFFSTCTMFLAAGIFFDAVFNGNWLWVIAVLVAWVVMSLIGTYISGVLLGLRDGIQDRVRKAQAEDE